VRCRTIVEHAAQPDRREKTCNRGKHADQDQGKPRGSHRAVHERAHRLYFRYRNEGIQFFDNCANAIRQVHRVSTGAHGPTAGSTRANQSFREVNRLALITGERDVALLLYYANDLVRLRLIGAHANQELPAHYLFAAERLAREHIVDHHV
jgi:hypothetical protein